MQEYITNKELLRGKNAAWNNNQHIQGKGKYFKGKKAK